MQRDFFPAAVRFLIRAISLSRSASAVSDPTPNQDNADGSGILAISSIASGQVELNRLKFTGGDSYDYYAAIRSGASLTIKNTGR